MILKLLTPINRDMLEINNMFSIIPCNPNIDYMAICVKYYDNNYKKWINFSMKFYVGDSVICLKNGIYENVYNGTEECITSFEGNTMKVKFEWTQIETKLK